MLTPLGKKHSPRKDSCFGKIWKYNPVTRLRRGARAEIRAFVMGSVAAGLPFFAPIGFANRQPEDRIPVYFDLTGLLDVEHGQRGPTPGSGEGRLWRYLSIAAIREAISMVAKLQKVSETA